MSFEVITFCYGIKSKSSQIYIATRNDLCQSKLKAEKKACSKAVDTVKKDKRRREAYWQKKYSSREKWWSSKLAITKSGIGASLKDLRKRYDSFKIVENYERLFSEI